MHVLRLIVALNANRLKLRQIHTYMHREQRERLLTHRIVVSRVARKMQCSPAFPIRPGQHVPAIGPSVEQVLSSGEFAENESTVERKPLPRILDHGPAKAGSARAALERADSKIGLLTFSCCGWLVRLELRHDQTRELHSL